MDAARPARPLEPEPEIVPDAGGVSTPIWFSPHGLARARRRYWAFAAFATLLLAVFFVGLAVPKSVETLPAAFLIVVAAGWLLSTRLALAIALAALALPMAEVVFREVDAASASVQVGVFGLLAIASRVYSTRLRRLLIGAVDHRSSMAASAFGLANLAQLTDRSTQGVAAVDQWGAIRYANAAAAELLDLAESGAEPADFYARVAAEESERVRSAFQAGDAGGYLNFSIRRADGSLRTVQATHTPVAVRDEPMVALALRDISEVTRLQLSATALAETAANLAVTQPLERTMAAIARRVIEVTDACACAIFLLEGERSVRLVGSWGLPPGYEAAANSAIQAGADPPVFQAVRTRRPVFVDDLLEVIRTKAHMAPMRDLVKDVSWKRAIAFPMVHSGRPLGGLSVYLRADQRMDEPTTDFLATMASQAATAAEISRLVALAQDQAAASERLHLSRELHDSLSQRLYGIVLGARAIDVRLAARTPEVAEALDYIVELAQGGLTEMRDIVLQLREDSLEKEGLIAAVSKHADLISGRYRLEVIKRMQEEPPISLHTKLAAYRIVLEALNNVAKHANARHVWLRVELEQGRLQLEVRDDGEGFDISDSAPGHFGLETMRERAGKSGGDLRVRSSRGGGTTVLASLPCGEVMAVS